MTNCNLCKKKWETSQFTCGHYICDICLGRVLILDEFSGLKNKLNSIEFICTCKKGNREISIADYIVILNNLLIENASKPIESVQDTNLSDELTSKLVLSVKKKKKNMRYKTFEEFSKFINTLESNLMKLFNEEVKKTLSDFDKIITRLNKAKENFINKMDLKATKLNSMFVILKMVFFNLYKDYDNLSDMKTLKFISEIKSDFYKIKFTPNVDQLRAISEEIASFEKNEHFLCKFVFASKPKNVLSWKTKSSFKDVNSSIISCLIQLQNGNLASCANDDKIKIWDTKKKIFAFSLSSHNQSNNRLIRKIVQISNGTIVSIAQNEVAFWNLKLKELTHTIQEQKGTILLTLKNIGANQIIISSNDNSIKGYNGNSFTCFLNLSFCSLCYSITPIKNGGLIFGLNSGDVLIHDNSNHISYENNIGKCTINTILEWKGKLIISSDDNDIKVVDSRDKRSRIDKLKGHTRSVMCMCSFDYKCIVSGSLDGSIRLWDLSKMKCLFVINEHSGWVTNVIKLKEGQLCSSGNDCEIKVLNYE